MRYSACTVLDRGPLGLELVAIDNEKLDIYNFKDDEWRNGSQTTVVSFSLKIVSWVAVVSCFLSNYFKVILKLCIPETFPIIINQRKKKLLTINEIYSYVKHEKEHSTAEGLDFRIISITAGTESHGMNKKGKTKYEDCNKIDYKKRGKHMFI